MFLKTVDNTKDTGVDIARRTTKKNEKNHRPFIGSTICRQNSCLRESKISNIGRQDPLPPSIIVIV